MSTAKAELEPQRKSFPKPGLNAGTFGTLLFLLIALPCFLTLPLTIGAPAGEESGHRYNDLRYDTKAQVDGKEVQIKTQEQWPGMVSFVREQTPEGGGEKVKVVKSVLEPMGTDDKGRSLFIRCLLGGSISLGVGICAALMAVFIGVTWGAMAGYLGGRTDAFMMRFVDVLYGLPYLLLVVLLSVAVGGVIDQLNSYVANQKTNNPSYEPMFILDLLNKQPEIINLLTLVVAIGGVSWLTMARVIRGQVLSLRTEPFIEAARAMGMGPGRILRVHLLPNLIGPIVVYTTLAVPQAILQESFLSFLGIGVTPPQPSWGQLASEGIKELPALAIPELSDQFEWWVLVFPCLLLGLTLLSLNFMGDAMREKFDPRSKKRGV